MIKNIYLGKVIFTFFVLGIQFVCHGHAYNSLCRAIVTQTRPSFFIKPAFVFNQTRGKGVYFGQYVDVDGSGIVQIRKEYKPNFQDTLDLNIKPEKIWPIEVWNSKDQIEKIKLFSLTSYPKPFLSPQTQGQEERTPTSYARFIFPKLESYQAANIFTVRYGEIFPISQDIFITDAHNIFRLTDSRNEEFVSDASQDIRIYGYKIINFSSFDYISRAQIMLHCFVHPLWHAHKNKMYNIAVVFVSQKYNFYNHELNEILSNKMDATEEYDISFVNKDVCLLGTQEYENSDHGEQILDAHKIVYYIKRMEDTMNQNSEKEFSYDHLHTPRKYNTHSIQLRSDLVSFLDDSIALYHKFIEKAPNNEKGCMNY